MADFFYTPTLGSDFRTRDAVQDRATARRLQNARAMKEFGDLAAAQGQSIGIDDWADMARQNLSFQDFMYGTSPSAKMIEQMRQNQNSAAERQAEAQRREQFTVERREEEDIRRIISDMALEGKSNEEIAAFVTQNFPQRSAALIPRIGAMTNAATLQARQQAFETYGKQFQDVESARAFIESNPGLNQAMRQGILEAAEINQAEMDTRAVAVGERLGAEYGYLPQNEQFSRNYIERLIPSTIKGERRTQLVERALDAAREAYRAKLASAQVGIGLEAQATDARNAPQQAERIWELGQKESDRRAAAAQATAQRYGSVIESQVAALGEFDKDNPTHKALGDRFATAQSLFNTYVFDNPQEVIQAIIDNDQRKLKELTSTARPVGEFMSQASALANVVTGATRFTDGAEAVQALSSMMGQATQRSLSTAGSLYGSEYAAAQNQPVRYTTDRRGRRVASTDPDAAAQVSAAAQSMRRIETSLLDDSVNLVLSARQALIDNGSISMSPEELQAMAQSIVSRSVDTFVRSANLPQAEADALRARILEQAMMRARVEGMLDRGITRRPSPEEQLEQQWSTMRTQRNLQPGYGWLPSQAPGDVRAPGAGAPQPNQRWWQR